MNSAPYIVVRRIAERLAALLLVFTGVLAVLTLVFLVSFSQLIGWGGYIAENTMRILLMPIVIDIFYLSPGLPRVLIYLLIVPLLLVSLLTLKITIEYFAGRGLKLPRPKLLRLGPLVELRERGRKLGRLTLVFVSIGATMGPSSFVIIPFAVIKYGPLALLGMTLASVSAWVLAWRYAKMYRYAKSIGAKEIVGGPAFVKYAYGRKHPGYILSRITMWMGNVALSAFNLLVATKFTSEYVLPVVTNVSGPPVEVAILALLSLAVLALYRKWEQAVGLQSIIGALFLFFFFAHLIGLYLAGPLSGVKLELPNIALGDPAEDLFLILASAAYVYIVVFGFQEVMALTEEAGGKDELEKLRNITIAMVGGSVASCLLFLAYMFTYVEMGQAGFEIPMTSLPAMDVARSDPVLYWVTVIAVFTGIASTLVPAFAAAIKHLGELVSDFFGARREDATSILPIVVVLFAWYLFLTGAEFIAHLTDFAVLFSLSIIAFSETVLGKKAEKSVGGSNRHHYLISKALSILTLLMLMFLALHSPDTAWVSALVMVVSTAMVMLLSYEAVIAEAFTLVVCALTIVFVGGLSKVVSELAAMGALTPLDVALWQGVTISLWVIHVVFFVLLIHVIAKYSSSLVRALKLGLIALIGMIRGG